ncbi:MAG TPA: TIGR04283 family arsenosugar biosynthesis glycosyltransferase [Geobacteraceae bacterium]|nr:TIGR04283 family arsenosugar biosynthesis glycosyltransferase [Geobacteraceae bacterium]
MNRPELTIIIPTLNEESVLAQTLDKLGRQQRISMEIIVVDGGSADATRHIARESLQKPAVIETPAGRSRQMNAGAVRATGEYLLFLHADSWFDHPMALRQGIDQLRHATAHPTSLLTGGHFSLTFAGMESTRSLGYAFYQRKARLNRPGCCHGDQGFLLPRSLFMQAGPFCEECDLLAQTRFADRLRHSGQWIRLTPEITTSARRFEKEGMRERQTLNAVIMACGAAGRDEFLEKIPSLYRQQQESGRGSLQPCLRQVQALVAALPVEERLTFWRRIGRYVVDNAWQTALFLDIAAEFLQKRDTTRGETRLLRLFDRYLYRLMDNRGGERCAEHLVRGWLRFMLLPSSPRNGTL